LAELKAHAEQHGGATGTAGHAEHDKMMEQQGQMMMSRLKSESGSALDHAFLEHHVMLKDKEGKDVTVKVTKETKSNPSQR
jgi:hypothetical protein